MRGQRLQRRELGRQPRVAELEHRLGLGTFATLWKTLEPPVLVYLEPL